MKPKVDFYILEQAGASTRFLFACKLANKVCLAGHSLFVYAKSQEQAEHLNNLLWTFTDISFLPHQCQPDPCDPNTPIYIGYDDMQPHAYDVLMNFAAHIPDDHHRFARILEIVSDDPHIKEQCREHYRFYQEKQYELQTHKVKH